VTKISQAIKPIQVLSSESTRANEIAIKTTKTSKVTAVVVGLSISSKQRCKLQSANLGNGKPSRHEAESANFMEENSRRSRNLLRICEKAGY
jgi:hypothetical protein